MKDAQYKGMEYEGNTCDEAVIWDNGRQWEVYNMLNTA